MSVVDPHIELDIVVIGEMDGGWAPVGALAELAGRSLGAQLDVLAGRGSRRGDRVRALVPPGRRSGRHLLLIAPLPGSLGAITRLDRGWVRSHTSITAWVVDSFWHERIPRVVRRGGWFDRLYVMDEDDVPAWSAATPAPVRALPWGADTLAVPAVPELDNTLLRVGRQPDAWDDDQITARRARAAGLAFRGRPGFGASTAEARAMLHRELARTRGVLAFGNAASPAGYTHPHREYLTGRWTEALAHGCVMVGRVPHAHSARELVPDFAHLEVSPTDPEGALHRIAEQTPRWDRALRERIRAHARARLDWRHRLAVIAADLDLTAPRLVAECALLLTPEP